MKITFCLITALCLLLPLGSLAQDKAAESMRVGRKTIVLSSVEGDGKCTQLVAPYELTSNLGELLQLGATEGLKEGLKSLSRIFTQGVAATPEARYKVAEPIRAAAIRMNWLPMTLEMAYGQHYHGVMRDGGMLLERADNAKLYAQADALLALALQSVTEPHPYTFQIHVRASNDGNALALPGGFLFLDSNLLRDPKNQNMAHIALAHELAHVLRRHETRALQARIVDTLALTGGVADMLNQLQDIARGSNEILNLIVSGKLQFERHKINQELQSDACAVRIAQTMLNDDTRLFSAVKDLLASLPPPITSANAAYISVTSTKMEDVAAIIERPVDRHPSTGERQALLNTVLQELTTAGVRQGLAPAPVRAATTKKP